MSNEFKVGDRVEFHELNADNTSPMLTGVVQSVGGNLIVRRDDNGMTWHVCLDNARPLPAPPREFAVGDRVRTSTGCYRGYTGTVREILGDGAIWLGDDSSEPAQLLGTWPSGELVHIDDPQDEPRGLTHEDIERVAGSHGRRYLSSGKWYCDGEEVDPPAGLAIGDIVDAGGKQREIVGYAGPMIYMLGGGCSFPCECVPVPTVTHTFDAVLPDGRTVHCPEPGEGWRCVGEVPLPPIGIPNGFLDSLLPLARHVWNECCRPADCIASPPRLTSVHRWERIPREHYAIRFPLLHEPAVERAESGCWPEGGKPPRYVKVRHEA